MRKCSNFITLCVWIVVSSNSNRVDREVCTDDQYFNLQLEICRNCSKCPSNLIVRWDCTNISDTVCGSFSEFDRFHNVLQYDKTGEVEVEDSKYTSNIYEKKRFNSQIEIEEVPTRSSEDRYWKKLAFALIGVLCVLIIVATMVVWYACRKLQASGQIKKPEDYDSDDADNGYVVIRSIRHTAPPGDQNSTLQSRDRMTINSTNYHLLRQQRLVRPYRPKRRLLNEYADDVFESEDSGGSRSSRRILSSIPEQSDKETSSVATATISQEKV